MKTDTICALCTPYGTSALSLIRLSGSQSAEIIRPFASFLPKKLRGNQVYVGVLKERGREVDQVVITYFASGKSFTGEETVEISCHGNPLICNDILKLLVSQGARMAEKGEYALRSFFNGKMDLIQAEALLQLIESRNHQTHKQAFYQLKGRFSNTLKALETEWLFLLSHLEADIDFSLENLSVFKGKDFFLKTEQLLKSVEDLLCLYRPFENLQKGLVVGIFGVSNVGKSTLFNALIEEDKSIVTNEEGTTRDVVEGLLHFEKDQVTLKDTAGLRFSKGEAEKLGMEKTRDLFETSDIRLLVLDGSCSDPAACPEFFKEVKEKTYVVWTKKDLAPLDQTKEQLFLKTKEASPAFFKNLQLEDTFFLSALTKEGLLDLKKKLFSLREEEAFLIMNFRHFQKLGEMKEALVRALKLLKRKDPEKDIVALELRQGLLALYEITGRQLEDRVLDEIFNQFCIGK